MDANTTREDIFNSSNLAQTAALVQFYKLKQEAVSAAVTDIWNVRRLLETKTRPCRERSLALTKLDEATFWIKSIPYEMYDDERGNQIFQNLKPKGGDKETEIQGQEERRQPMTKYTEYIATNQSWVKKFYRLRLDNVCNDEPYAGMILYAMLGSSRMSHLSEYGAYLLYACESDIDWITTTLDKFEIGYSLEVVREPKYEEES